MLVRQNIIAIYIIFFGATSSFAYANNSLLIDILDKNIEKVNLRLQEKTFKDRNFEHYYHEVEKTKDQVTALLLYHVLNEIISKNLQTQKTNTHLVKIYDKLRENLLHKIDEKLVLNQFFVTPDGTKIYPLGSVMKNRKGENKGASVIYTIIDKNLTFPVKSIRYSEKWFFLSGNGQIKIKDNINNRVSTIDINPGVTVKIPVNHHYQIRKNKSCDQIKLVIITQPPFESEKYVQQVKSLFPIKEDKKYIRDMEIKERNTFAKIFLSNLNDTRKAVNKLKTTWKIENDQQLYAKIINNNFEVLEYTIKQILFKHFLILLKDAFFKQNVLKSEAFNKKEKNIIRENYKNSYVKIDNTIKNLMKDAHYQDFQIMAEQWLPRLMTLSAKKEEIQHFMKTKNLNFMIPEFMLQVIHDKSTSAKLKKLYVNKIPRILNLPTIKYDINFRALSQLIY